MLKDLVVSLTQILMKKLVMDVGMDDVPPTYGIFRSWSLCSWGRGGWLWGWGEIGKSLQLDMSYATMLVFGGENRRLYIEIENAYMIRNSKNSQNFPIYNDKEDIDIFSIYRIFIEPTPHGYREDREILENQVLDIFFDWYSTKGGARASIVFISPNEENYTFSYKLEFETTNNIVEYQALALGLEAMRRLNCRIFLYINNQLGVE